MKHLNIKIFGRVQGVGFRLSAQNLAYKLNITGFVRNEEDDTVYIEAEGKKENLESFLAWCQKGPLMAKVEKIEPELSPELKKFSNFDIF